MQIAGQKPNFQEFSRCRLYKQRCETKAGVEFDIDFRGLSIQLWVTVLRTIILVRFTLT